MKRLILIMAALSLLSACDNGSDEPTSGTRAIDVNCLNVRFVGESGALLGSDIPLDPAFPGYSILDRSYYTLHRWCNGFDISKRVDELEAQNGEGSLWASDDHLERAYPDGITFNCFPETGESPNRAATYEFKFTFSCPAIFGDNSDHTLVFSRKRENLGLHNNAEEVFFDGELIARDLPGGENGPNIPVEIIVAGR